MTNKEYNGWYNYETWIVNLWMDNEQGTQAFWLEQAKESIETAIDTTTPDGKPFSLTPEERAAITLAQEIQDYHETRAADMLEAAESSATFLADLLNGALSEVNWHEIAAHWIDTAKQEATPHP